jgi:hypothetical protein
LINCSNSYSVDFLLDQVSFGVSVKGQLLA